MHIRQDDPTAPAVAALIRLHQAESLGSTPAANAHALDAAGLASPDITFWTAWDDDALLGMAAMREIDAAHGELKSMRTAVAARRRGVARALLDHAVAAAHRRGYRRLSLETGTAPMFAAANRLYERAGFVDGPVFGHYPDSPHNRFMHLEL